MRRWLWAFEVRQRGRWQTRNQCNEVNAFFLRAVTIRAMQELAKIFAQSKQLSSIGAAVCRQLRRWKRSRQTIAMMVRVHAACRHWGGSRIDCRRAIVSTTDIAAPHRRQMKIAGTTGSAGSSSCAEMADGTLRSWRMCTRLFLRSTFAMRP